MLLRGGVSIIPALTILSHQQENPNFGVVVDRITERVAGGHRLAHSMSVFPGVFPPVFISMIRLGEASGRLTEVLDRVADWLERDEQTARRVKGALTYPCVVIAIAATLTLLLFTTVLPQFLDMFQNLGVELPLLTRVMMGLTGLIKQPGTWTLILVTVFGLTIGLRDMWSRENGKLVLYKFLSELPFIGRLLHFASLSRFASAAETALETGVEIRETLRLGGAASGNPILAHDVQEMVRAVAEGSTVSEYMATKPTLYHSTLLNLVQAGEVAADLPMMLRYVGRFYDEEVEMMTENLGVILESAILLGVAIMVGLVLLSVFLPLYGHIGSLGA